MYFTSDTHFNHSNILKYELENRKFSTVEEMNEAIIRVWNETIQPEDTVYHLGDFAFGNSSKVEGILDRLNGNIILIRGNHDNKEFLTELRNHEKVKLVKDYIEFKYKKILFVLFHYPIHEWNGCHRGAIHLYGHVHDRGNVIGGKSMNVGVDTRMKPYHIDEIIKLMEDKPLKDHH